MPRRNCGVCIRGCLITVRILNSLFHMGPHNSLLFIHEQLGLDLAKKSCVLVKLLHDFITQIRVSRPITNIERLSPQGQLSLLDFFNFFIGNSFLGGSLKDRVSWLIFLSTLILNKALVSIVPGLWLLSVVFSGRSSEHVCLLGH